MILKFDKSKADAKLINFESEAVRLYQEILPKKAYSFKHLDGTIYNYSSRRGFNIETASIKSFYDWLNDSSIKKSKASFWFVVRCLAMKFPDKHGDIKKKLAPHNRLEFELILSELRNEIQFLGEVGFSGLTEISKPNKHNILVFDKHKEIKIRRK